MSVMCELQLIMGSWQLIIKKLQLVMGQWNVWIRVYNARIWPCSGYLIGHNLIVNVINEWQLNIVNYKFFNEWIIIVPNFIKVIFRIILKWITSFFRGQDGISGYCTFFWKTSHSEGGQWLKMLIEPIQ